MGIAACQAGDAPDAPPRRDGMQAVGLDGLIVVDWRPLGSLAVASVLRAVLPDGNRAPMLCCPRLLTAVLGLYLLSYLPSCGVKTPLLPVNRSPVVQSLMAFPASISPGDSAVVVCHATDPDGEPVVFDWTSDCRLIKQGAPGAFTAYQRGSSLVVYAGTCAHAPLDTGWVSCHVRDGRGGGANAGVIRIVIRQ